MGKSAAVFLALYALLGPACLFGEAPPVEFGLEAIRQAVRDRGLAEGQVRIRTEISTSEPESYRTTGYRVTGGDLRGLMYGLLAAADQVRRHGRLVPERSQPAVPIRGIRRFLHNEELEREWYYSRDYWLDYIQMLARNRFNRLNLVFAHQTDYLAPPYPYWVEVEEFPEIRVPGLSSEQRTKNLETLCYIAQTAADHAVDFTLGVWEHNIQRDQTPTVEGLTDKNIGPYSYAALKQVLSACPAIRSVQFRTNWESGIPPERQVEFYRDYVYRALREAGRLVKLDLRGWTMSDGMLESAVESGVPMRLSSKYWAEHLGRPYQPAETFPGYSYIDFLRRDAPQVDGRLRPYDFFWELWGLGSHRLLLWGDPDYVKRVVGTLTMSDTSGFEIDEPLAQKGFGNRPGQWGVFAAGQEDRKFWKWDFERYWLFYLLWGRLTYDPKLPERVWLDEFELRFGDAAAEALDSYRNASGVLHEIVTAHMPDPNMYMWPEINPGGLIDYYAASPPSDRRLVASFHEAVQNRVRRVASAKQTPEETAARLLAIAEQLDTSLATTAGKLPPDHQEWSGTEPDFRVLALLARFHSHRQIAADRLTNFYETGDREGLLAAREQLETGLKLWRELVSYTENLYPPDMAFGPEDFGHWRDKLSFLQHDLKTLDEREWLLDRFGQFEFGFDFGGEPGELGYLERIHASVEPRFQSVHPETAYSEKTGNGWVSEGQREAAAMEGTARGNLRATAHNPRNLPENALFGDSIKGHGSQTFRVRTVPGEFLVTRLYPDGNATSQQQDAVNGVVDVRFPEEPWEVSAVIVKSLKPETRPVPLPNSELPTRPAIAHTAPVRATPGRPLTLSVNVTPAAAATKVRLHYRRVNALEEFRTLEAEAGRATFTILAEEISTEWDILYYFEVLSERAGWFHPDPDERTPYYVVPVRGATRARRR